MDKIDEEWTLTSLLEIPLFFAIMVPFFLVSRHFIYT